MRVRSICRHFALFPARGITVRVKVTPDRFCYAKTDEKERKKEEENGKKEKKSRRARGITYANLLLKYVIYRNETALVYAECNGDLTRLVPSAKTELVGVALGNLESDGLCKVSAGIVAGVVTVFIKLIVDLEVTG